MAAIFGKTIPCGVFDCVLAEGIHLALHINCIDIFCTKNNCALPYFSRNTGLVFIFLLSTER